MQLLFFTSATGKYNEFVLPFITSSLLSNPDSAVEVLTDNPASFLPAMNLLDDMFGSRAAILPIPPKFFGWTEAAYLSATIRFLTYPCIEADYTYIGDVDILTLEAVAAGHLDHIHRTRMCYSNIIRPGTKRLTGLHFVDSHRWYGRISPQYMELIAEWYQGSNLGNDEALLYRITKDYFGLPNPDDDYRPIHGIHISPNRAIDGNPNWGITTRKIELLNNMIQTPEWKAIMPYYSESFNEYIRQIFEHGQTLENK